MIIGSFGLAVIVVLIAYYLSGKKTKVSAIASNPNIQVNGEPPKAELFPETLTDVTPEVKIISHMRWLNSGTVEDWINQTIATYGFTRNQALAFIAIREGKIDNKDVPMHYAGTTDPNGHALWVKKYVQ